MMRAIGRGADDATPGTAGHAARILDSRMVDSIEEAARAVRAALPPPLADDAGEGGGGGELDAARVASAVAALLALSPLEVRVGLGALCDHLASASDALVSRLRMNTASCNRLALERGVVDAVAARLEAEVAGGRQRIEELRTSAAAASIERDRLAALLRRAAAWLKPGGRLIYATCSLFPQEGERIAERVIAGLPREIIEASELPAGLKPAADGWVRTLPGQVEGGIDGFFIARFRKLPD